MWFEDTSWPFCDREPENEGVAIQSTSGLATYEGKIFGPTADCADIADASIAASDPTAKNTARLRRNRSSRDEVNRKDRRDRKGYIFVLFAVK
jgi:hypothetical protein